MKFFRFMVLLTPLIPSVHARELPMDDPTAIVGAANNENSQPRDDVKHDAGILSIMTQSQDAIINQAGECERTLDVDALADLRCRFVTGDIQVVAGFVEGQVGYMIKRFPEGSLALDQLKRLYTSTFHEPNLKVLEERARDQCPQGYKLIETSSSGGYLCHTNERHVLIMMNKQVMKSKLANLAQLQNLVQQTARSLNDTRGQTDALKCQKIMAKIDLALQQYRRSNLRLPTSDEGLSALVAGRTADGKGHGSFLDAAMLKDPWGSEFRYISDSIESKYFLTSAGPDLEFGTSDDIVFPD